MNRTKIPWVRNADGKQGYTWNPIVGCSPASEGCEHCYAAAMSKRFNLPWGKPVFMPDRIDEPMKVKKPSTIFVCSMSDLFHEEVPIEWQEQILHRMVMLKRHTFILLTKRAERMAWVMNGLFRYRMGDKSLTEIPGNIWLGVTAENQARYDERVPILMSIPAKVRFVSVEPMLGPVETIRQGTGRPEWVIAGPENGAGARKCDPWWIEAVRAECQFIGTPFFDKREHAGAIREMPWERQVEG